MKKDTHKGISNIEYNSLNLPMSIEIDNGQGIKGSVQYLYSARGVKLQTIHKTDGAAQRTPMAGAVAFETETTGTKTTDYVGNKIYENGELVKILFDGGYYDVNEKKYYFYIQDHLGNNRVVADAEGKVIQKSDYYPFGMEFADNTEPEKQPYKYNGKELDKQHGLNMYDYSARYMEPAIGRFTSVDPLAEKYYSISPYVYVANNPLKYIDPTGEELEKPIIWVKNIPGSQNIYKQATTMPYQIGDNFFDVFAHANNYFFMNSKAENHGDKFITSPEQFVGEMSKYSPEFKEAMENGTDITVKLHACNTGGNIDPKGDYVKDPIAKKISEEYPNITVIAPTGTVVVDKNGEKGIYDKHNGEGAYVTYKNGKVIETDNSVNIEKKKE